MTPAPEDAADSPPDPKLQADQVLAKVSAMIGASLQKIRVTAADSNTLVCAGYPCTVVSTERVEKEF